MIEQPPPLIQDPGLRYLLVAARRAMLTLCKAIEEVTNDKPIQEEPRRVA